MDMWPEGVESAVAFTFDFDAEELWVDEHPVARSQGTFGAKVGLPEILRILEVRRVRATFFVVGAVAVLHPDPVRRIVEAGHELAVHGYTHRPPRHLDEEDERRELIEAHRVLSGFGAEVVGYRAPGWEVSERTVRLLDELGFRYSSNFMDDIRPYLHPGTSVVELPVQWILDDAPYFWFDGDSWGRSISSAAQVRSIWEAELEGIHRLGGLAVLTLHPQIIGRPGRLGLLEEILDTTRSRTGAWVATCGEIASSANVGGTREPGGPG